MITKKPDLDDATLRVMKKVLAMPPKPHGELKATQTAIVKAPAKPTKKRARKD